MLPFQPLHSLLLLFTSRFWVIPVPGADLTSTRRGSGQVRCRIYSSRDSNRDSLWNNITTWPVDWRKPESSFLSGLWVEWTPVKLRGSYCPPTVNRQGIGPSSFPPSEMLWLIITFLNNLRVFRTEKKGFSLIEKEEPKQIKTQVPLEETSSGGPNVLRT